MTITYTGKVANARMFAFSRLLFYWKGSIYKLIYKEMTVFCILYAILSLVYRFALNKEHKNLFEKIVLHCEMFANLIPLSFVLGFYVSIVITRWWNQFVNIPWPDRAMMYASVLIDGVDERTRIIRRTLMRYLTLSSLIVFQATSVVVKKRFPTMEHLLEAGVITIPEIQALEDVNTPHGKWWVPIVWACNLIKQARKEGRISDAFFMKTLLEEILTYRGQLGMLYSYDWISVPLVYTQVTTLAVYSFFVGCLFGRQFIEPDKGYPGHEVDLYVPVFTLLQFFFYMGWLKVAEQLINPFGEDDDDYDMNWIIDRNLQVSLLVVDDLHGFTPKPEKDMYFGESPPDFLPYTKSSISSLRQPYMGSTADLSVSDHGMQVVTQMITIPEGCVLDSNTLSPYTNTANIQASRPTSPIPSPSKSRRLQNMLHGIRTPLGASKSSIDGFKVGSYDAKSQNLCLNLGQNLNGVGISQRNFVENWVSEQSSATDHVGTSVSLMMRKSSTVGSEHLSTAPGTPLDDKSIFTMEMDENGGSKQTSSYDMKNICLENPDVTRVRHIEIGPNNRRYTVSEYANPLQVLQNSLDVQDGLHMAENVCSANNPSAANAYMRSQSVPVQPESHTLVSVLAESEQEVPEIVIDNPDRRDRHVSGSSKGSSCSSFPGYDPPDSNQSTVSSLTPLLPHSGSNPSINV